MSPTSQWKIMAGEYKGKSLTLELGDDTAVLTLPGEAPRELKLDSRTANFQESRCCLSFWKSPQLEQPRLFFVEEVVPAETARTGDTGAAAGQLWVTGPGSSAYRMLGAQAEQRGPLAPLKADPDKTADAWLGITWTVMFKEGPQPVPPTASGFVNVQLANQKYGIYYTERRGAQPIGYDELSFNRQNFTLDSKPRSIAYWRRAAPSRNIIFAMFDAEPDLLLPFERRILAPGDDPVGVWGAEEG